MIELSFAAVLLLLGAGFVFLALEVFVTPGLGVKGVIGLGLILAAIVIAFTAHGPLKGSMVLGVAGIVLVGGGWIAKETVGRRLVLSERLPENVETESALAPLIGRAGLAVTPLRPAGVARIDDRRLDVTAENEFLDAGTPVVVVSVQGNKVKVARQP